MLYGERFIGNAGCKQIYFFILIMYNNNKRALRLLEKSIC